ncbi:MAG: phosphatidate cytidylyltransferase [Bryobacteraceae bacterium]
MKRVVTALVLIPVVVYVALWGSHWLFLLVTSAVALLCFREYCGIVASHQIDKPGPAAYAAGLLVLLTPMPDGLLVTLLALLALTLMLRSAEMSRGLPGAAAFVLGIVYIFGTWRCAVPLRAVNPYWLLFALSLNWVGDTAAYIVGRVAGRHKLAPRLSPAKTWEGSAASLVASLAFGFFYLGGLIPEVSPEVRLGIAAAGNIAGQVGDLAESLMKRGAGLKDSSNLLPGHGGWLDRLDSTLFALPVIYGLLVALGLSH